MNGRFRILRPSITTLAITLIARPVPKPSSRIVSFSVTSRASMAMRLDRLLTVPIARAITTTEARVVSAVAPQWKSRRHQAKSFEDPLIAVHFF